MPLPPTPGIAQEQFSKQLAAPAANSDSPALPVAEPPPDQSPSGSERQPPTPALAGLNSAVSDAVNSDNAIHPVVPSTTDHATSTSRSPRNERVSRRPEHTSWHTRAVRVAAAKKPIWRDFRGRLARKTNGASSHVVARTANGASSDVVLGELSPSTIT